jgi:hypothetical protein
VLRRLERAGVRTRDLYLAWDFTVASTRSITGDLLRIRDDAFATLGGAAPAYTVTEVRDLTPEQDARIAREVVGTVAVPSYLDLPGGPPGSTFHRGPDGAPARLPGNVQTARFRCEIPRVAYLAPSRPSLYGHGLLGSADEVGAGNVKAMANEHGFTFCATDWIGMAAEDIPTVVSSLLDINRFPAVADRLQQGVLDTLFLGRLLVHPRGFAADPAFRTAAGRPLLDVAHGLSYDGNSQGGILGGITVAVSQDVRRGVLGVTGMNYSVLLNRSADFPPFAAWLGLGTRQARPAARVRAAAAPLGPRRDRRLRQPPRQPPAAAADAAARRPHAHRVRRPPGRERAGGRRGPDDRRPAAGARARAGAQSRRRAVLGDPARGRRGPWDGDGRVGQRDAVAAADEHAADRAGVRPDPHSDPRNTVAARLQKSVFLRTGIVVDVCGGAPCRTDAAPPADCEPWRLGDGAKPPVGGRVRTVGRVATCCRDDHELPPGGPR